MPLAELLARALHLESRWMLAPVSGAIAAIGHDWPAVGEWVLRRLGRLIERKTGAQE